MPRSLCHDPCATIPVPRSLCRTPLCASSHAEAALVQVPAPANADGTPGTYVCATHLVTPSCLLIRALARTRPNCALAASLSNAHPRAKCSGTVPIPTWEYDLQELKKAAQQVLMGAAFTALLVLQFNVYQVLLIQPLMLLRGAFTSPIVRIHVLGYAATDANKRPFVVSNPLACVVVSRTRTRTYLGGMAGSRSRCASIAGRV